MMWAPRILSVLASEMNLTRPSASSTVRALEFATKANLPTLYSPPSALTCAQHILKPVRGLKGFRVSPRDPSLRGRRVKIIGVP